MPFTQGVALGWYVAALSGLRKIKSFWELAILVTLKLLYVQDKWETYFSSIP
jgi:hypothetical protein